MEGLNGDRLRIELLCEQAWLLANAAKLGATIDLEMHELGVSGPVTVTYLGPCPEIQPGPGNVIIGRFIHESAGNLLNIRMEGEAEPVGVTDNHLYWSVDRKQYIPSGQLRQGERVDTLFGERTIASITPPSQRRSRLQPRNPSGIRLPCWRSRHVGA